MTIKIQSGRQFAAGDTSVALFDEKGKAGTYLAKASDKLVAHGVSVQLKGARNKTITLATADDWKGFLSKYCATKQQSAQFAKHFGITFTDFCNTLDDAAASDDKGLTLDLRPTSELAKALSLDKVDGDYGSKLAARTPPSTSPAPTAPPARPRRSARPPSGPTSSPPPSAPTGSATAPSRRTGPTSRPATARRTSSRRTPAPRPTPSSTSRSGTTRRRWSW